MMDKKASWNLFNYPYKSLFRRHIALTREHGTWVFVLSPLLIGLFAGGRWTMDTLLLTIAVLAAFLIRQPITIAIKAYSERRTRQDLPAAYFWTTLYGIIGTISFLILFFNGFGFLLYLILPGIPVFAWHLFLVSKRAERRKMGVEIIAIGVLALSAPAGYWVSIGEADPSGWWLWGLTWIQSAASIVYAYLRLEQRILLQIPDIRDRFRMGKRALLYTTFNLLTVLFLSISQRLPQFIFIPFFVQWSETLWGILKPAIGYKPTIIGLRQLFVSSSFTVLFIFTW